MRLKVLLTICSVLLAACAGAPAKPVIRLGVIDYPRQQVIENNTGSRGMQPVMNANSFDAIRYRALFSAITSQGSNRVPLASYDHGVCFVPPEWEKLQNYLHALERFAQNHCQ